MILMDVCPKVDQPVDFTDVPYQSPPLILNLGLVVSFVCYVPMSWVLGMFASPSYHPLIFNILVMAYRNMLQVLNVQDVRALGFFYGFLYWGRGLREGCRLQLKLQQGNGLHGGL